jgi:ectoine hydroxylase-related dioxygenase (phytanoyl-CoA dioxygenase family)
MSSVGFHVIEDHICIDEIEELRKDCLSWVDRCGYYQVAAGLSPAGDSTAHHAVDGKSPISVYLAHHRLHAYLSSFIGTEQYILHACNPVSGRSGLHTYVHNIHRDVATFIDGYHLRINVLIPLVDFTIENGATKILLGSHRLNEKPEGEYFESNCVDLLVKAGSAVLFDSYLWHRGAINSCDYDRVALTLSYGPAFVKPQMDYARLLGDDYFENQSDRTRQVLGYYSRVPTTHTEWYQKPESRLYRSNQG